MPMDSSCLLHLLLQPGNLRTLPSTQDPLQLHSLLLLLGHRLKQEGKAWSKIQPTALAICT